MQVFEENIPGIDGSQAKLVGYVIDNSPAIDAERRRPAVLVLPGGAYMMTADSEAEPVALRMIGYGYQAFVLRYSVAPSRYPVALLQTAEAMRRIRAHAMTWHVDARAVVIAGFSAGGHLAANLATGAGDDRLTAHGYSPDAVRPDGLMLGYPVITAGHFTHQRSIDALLGDASADRSALAALSMERHVNRRTPPTFIWHTVTDPDVPVQNSLMFISACVEHHVPVEAHLFPHGGHGLSLGTAETSWNGTEGIEECIQVWPELFARWMRRRFGR